MAEYVELSIEQGTTFSTTINVNENDGSPKDLTTYSARSQMRKSYYSSSSKDFTMTKTDAAGGEITMSMSAANTSLLTPGRWVYDVEIEDQASVVTRIFEGIVVVMPGVTR